ncbi:unnamed protein product, partial [Owenia fusiformis]
GKMAAPTKVEFAVQMTCQSCVDTIQNALETQEGIKSVQINLAQEQVIVESTLTTTDVQRLIEATGRTAVVTGLGSASEKKHLGAAVSMIGGSSIQGVVRMVQSDADLCIIEGTVDGLQPGGHSIAIHELGDLSKGCESCGDIFNPDNRNKKIYGSLGNITANERGRATFRFENPTVKVWDIIGRSMMVKDDAETTKRLACGIIARSAGLFQNSKKICACDGVTLWDERNVPLAGDGRSRAAKI